MPSWTHLTPPLAEPPVSSGWLRARQALAPHRLALALAMTLLMSTRLLQEPGVVEFYSGVEIVLELLRHTLELLPVSIGLLLTYVLVDELLPRDAPWRLLPFVVVLAAATCGLVFAFLAVAWDFERLPDARSVIGQAMVWATPPVFCALIADADRRTRRLDAQALDVGADRARLEREEIEQRLQQLQAQIEPHFLFNTLANLRRLYRTQPHSAAEMTEQLQRYLRSALPQLRQRRATLGDELTLVEAYLALFRMRMGARLAYAVDAPAALRALDFPPVLLLTLVENAIKHGIDPKADGGRVDVRARRDGATLTVEVRDDGVGFGAVAGGTGVGLTNVRRRLATLFGRRAGLELRSRDDGPGVAAVVRLPAKMG